MTTTNWIRGQAQPPPRQGSTARGCTSVEPEARVTMGNDMSAETWYNVMELPSEPLGRQWEASRQTIEQRNKEFGLEPAGSGTDPICDRKFVRNKSRL